MRGLKATKKEEREFRERLEEEKRMRGQVVEVDGVGGGDDDDGGEETSRWRKRGKETVRGEKDDGVIR